ncbi:hypothetical protein BaRGS_00039851 [Batillaria attramentaria]|uniref:Uncharacterized protein n=1 Tax=Batillaria attramentaria TaxID=370345 RepID=A0ABD0J1V9_9CAEN
MLPFPHLLLYRVIHTAAFGKDKLDSLDSETDSVQSVHELRAAVAKQKQNTHNTGSYTNHAQDPTQAMLHVSRTWHRSRERAFSKFMTCALHWFIQLCTGYICSQQGSLFSVCVWWGRGGVAKSMNAHTKVTVSPLVSAPNLAVVNRLLFCGVLCQVLHAKMYTTLMFGTKLDSWICIF